MPAADGGAAGPSSAPQRFMMRQAVHFPTPDGSAGRSDPDNTWCLTVEFHTHRAPRGRIAPYGKRCKEEEPPADLPCNYLKLLLG